MTQTGHDTAQTIAALSVAAEFILCAIRALSNGCDPKGQDVRDPVKWADSKLREAKELLLTTD